MNIAYIFKTNMSATFQLGTMILPQLEKNIHGANVVAMFFFDENVYALEKNNEIGKRLEKIAKKNKILIMACDQCALRRGLAEGTIDMCGTGKVKPKNMIKEAKVGCFPQLYDEISKSGKIIKYIITL
jgi:sulfur relay (sulfurtransferase) complex TusBCD TusD component (DsrE family)